MEFPPLEASEIEAFRANFTVSESQQEHLERCWHHQDCRGCLASSECSWCPFSWSCVPNAYKVPALAPAYEEDVCPHWAERWEIRTRPLGCQVSTITSLTAIISIVSTLLVILILSLLVIGIRRLSRYMKGRRLWGADWRRRRWETLTQRKTSREREPLLPQRIEEPTTGE